jgi:hypothetical protein
MFQTMKLKPDRSIGGWIVPLSMLAVFGISLLTLGFRRGLFVLVGLILLYALYSLYVFIRTGNFEHLVLCAYQVFLGSMAFFLPSYVGKNRIEPLEGVAAYLIGLIFFGVLIVFLAATKRLKWRGREILELAAEPVEETGNGYTARPRPVGRVEFSKQEILNFARFCARHLISVNYVNPRQAVFVPVRMGQEYTYLFRIGGAHPDSTWISFDFDGEVATHIAQKDYLDYQEPLAFDKLCESLGRLFIEFAEMHRRGEGARIIDRMNALQLSFLA